MLRTKLRNKLLKYPTTANRISHSRQGNLCFSFGISEKWDPRTGTVGGTRDPESGTPNSKGEARDPQSGFSANFLSFL